MQCNAAVVRRQRVEPQETAAGSTREPSKTLFKNEKNTGLSGLYPQPDQTKDFSEASLAVCFLGHLEVSEFSLICQ